MKRAWRLFIFFMAGFSVLVSLASAILWPLSWSSPKVVSRDVNVAQSGTILKGERFEESSIQIYSMRGGIDLRIYWHPAPSGPSGPTTWSCADVSGPMRLSEFPGRTSIWNRLGFFWMSGVPGGSNFGAGTGSPAARFVFVGIPYWILTLPGVLVFALFVWCWKRARPALANRCVRCGYDLRASPDRCPECGALKTVHHAN